MEVYSAFSVGINRISLMGLQGQNLIETRFNKDSEIVIKMDNASDVSRFGKNTIQLTLIHLG